MANYLCVQRNLPGSVEGERPSPAQMDQILAQFNAWREKFRDHLVDLGGRLGAGKLIAANEPPEGRSFIEVNQLAAGYMIVSAESLEEAVAVASKCPGLVRPGSGVEVIEIRAP